MKNDYYVLWLGCWQPSPLLPLLPTNTRRKKIGSKYLTYFPPYLDTPHPNQWSVWARYLSQLCICHKNYKKRCHVYFLKYEHMQYFFSILKTDVLICILGPFLFSCPGSSFYWVRLCLFSPVSSSISSILLCSVILCV